MTIHKDVDPSKPKKRKPRGGVSFDELIAWCDSLQKLRIKKILKKLTDAKVFMRADESQMGKKDFCIRGRDGKQIVRFAEDETIIVYFHAKRYSNGNDGRNELARDLKYQGMLKEDCLIGDSHRKLQYTVSQLSPDQLENLLTTFFRYANPYPNLEGWNQLS